MEEYKHIRLTLGDCSLEQELGVYYIDFTNSEIHYTSGFYGDHDANGLPMVGYGEQAQYYPINIAQYGLLLHAKYRLHKDERYLIALRHCVDKLCELGRHEGTTFVWRHDSVSERHNLSSGWASAMAQGECISLFLRWFQISNDERYLKLSNDAYEFMKIDVKEGGVRNHDIMNNMWLEEYPSPDGPSCVLNGFIYALFGLYDLYRVTHREDVKADIALCLDTLNQTLHKFDVGYWSLYDLYTYELVRYYYQLNVHVPQLAALYRLTGNTLFSEYAEKWRKTVTPLNYLFVQLMYRVRPRWIKLQSALSFDRM